MTAKKHSPLSFEAALTELESVVARLEQGELSLEETLQRFEQGVALTRTCQIACNWPSKKWNNCLRKTVTWTFCRSTRRRRDEQGCGMEQALSSRANQALDQRLPAADLHPGDLHQAMRYAVLGGQAHPASVGLLGRRGGRRDA